MSSADAPRPVRRQHWAHGALEAVTVAGGAIIGSALAGPVGGVTGAAIGGALATRIPYFESNPTSSPILVDVRSRREQIQDPSFLGSLTIPATEVGPHTVRLLRNLSLGGAIPVYIFCRRGIRARRVVSYLRQNGIDARNIGGTDVGLAQQLITRQRDSILERRAVR